jgi:hypothetical protein
VIKLTEAQEITPYVWVHPDEDPTLRRERGPPYAFTMQGLYATGSAPHFEQVGQILLGVPPEKFL